MQDFLNSNVAKKMLETRLPRYNELPDIELYMDQVISIIDSIIMVLFPASEEKIITPTMINNYVKQKIVSPPKKKKYSKTHLAYLIVVRILKQVFSIAEICELINIQIKTYSIDVAYDFFCNELENGLKSTFSTRDFSVKTSTTAVTAETEVVRSGIMSFTNKLYIQKYLDYLHENQEYLTENMENKKNKEKI